jgi:hypothetical protein
MLIGSLTLGQIRAMPSPDQDVWEETFFHRFYLVMHKTTAVFDPDFVGKKRGGQPVWEFRIKDDKFFDAPVFTGADTFSMGRAAAIRWAMARHHRSLPKSKAARR